MGTSAMMVNTSTTETSSLFLEKQRSARHGPSESFWEGLNMAGLMATWKEALYTLDVPIYRVGAPKWDLSYDICSVITAHMPSTRSSG